jgi:hypothetical protein
MNTAARRVLVMRRMAGVFFAAYAIGVTYPGVVLFRGPRPFVFGLPLPMVWVTFWVVGGCAVFWLLDRAYRAAAEDGSGAARSE